MNHHIIYEGLSHPPFPGMKMNTYKNVNWRMNQYHSDKEQDRQVNGRTIGIELELQGNIQELLDAFKSYDKFLFPESDGSISGVEFVSIDNTLEWWELFVQHIRMNKDLQKKLRKAIQNKVGNGMHIHFDRKQKRIDMKNKFSDSLTFSNKAALMLTKIFRNENQLNHYCKFANNYSDHYNWINFRNKTFEFRCWKGIRSLEDLYEIPLRVQIATDCINCITDISENDNSEKIGWIDILIWSLKHQESPFALKCLKLELESRKI